MSGGGGGISATIYNMGIEEVATIIDLIADGLEDACAKCLEDNADFILLLIKEQLYSGQNGKGQYLDPNYRNDSFFDQEGRWYHKAEEYERWKYEITPPIASRVLGLPPRPKEVPNLYINGKFYGEINAYLRGHTLEIDPGGGNGIEIVDKWGEDILTMGEQAKEFFNAHYMLPAIDEFFKRCGYQ